MLHRLLEGLEKTGKTENGDGQSAIHHPVLTPELKPTPVIGSDETHLISHVDELLLGIGLDSCVIPLRHGELFLVQSTDFFYPLVDDPYVMVPRGERRSSRVSHDLCLG